MKAMCFSIQATIAVRNLVECLKLSRGNELDQMNFSRLDLRLCSFVNCSLIGCCFVEAQLADGAFFNLDFPMKDISITNNGSIIVLTEVHFLLVYERHFGICVLRAKIAASDAFYVSGNLIVFAAHSGGITWFDTESLMNGQISGITYASEIKGVFLDKRGSSLAVYLDNRPNNTAKIVFYHLTKKEGEYDAVCCRYFLLIIVLGEIPEAITNYGELLARKLVDRITVSDEEIVVEMKSGLEIKAKT